jgi:hypothetical protein
VTVNVAFLVILTTVFCFSKYVRRSTRESEDRLKMVINDEREQTGNTKDMQSQGFHNLYPMCI